MRRLTRYILTRIFHTTLFTLIALVSLYAFFDVLGELSNIGRNAFTWKTLIVIVALNLPNHIYQLLPLALLIGSLIALALLASGSEYAVMRASGASSTYMARILLLAGSLCAILTLLLGEFVAPYAEQEAERIYLHATRSLVAQDFRSGLWVKDNNHFINVREMLPDNTLRRLSIYEYDSSYRLTHTLQADSAQFIGQGTTQKTLGRWLLQNVTSTAIMPTHTHVVRVANLMWESVLRPEILDVLLVSPEKMSALKLIDYIQHLKNNRQKTERYEIALWSKLFYPLACLSMALIAVAATPINQRQINLGGRIVLGVAIGLGFYFFNRFLGHLGLLYHWQPIVVTLVPTLLFLSAGSYLCYRQERHR